MKISIPLSLFMLTASLAHAGEVEIVNAEAIKSSGNAYTFHVTLKHADTGWDHYANEWQVWSNDGDVLGIRTLHHPHVKEQPFTRSLGNVKAPEGATSVLIKARDSVHGVSPKPYPVELPK